MNNYEMVATTLTGLEGVLAKELIKLGGRKVTELRRAVTFFGDDELLYKANLSLRTALRILVPIDEFRANNEDELYDAIYAFPWEEVFSLEQTFAIDTVVNGRVFKHSKYVALKSKDAIVDRFRRKTGERPSVNPTEPDIYLNIKVLDNKVVVSIDSTGISLDKRGYRTNANEAPINEVLAAGIILHTGWKPTQAFLDPMSGSGTFSIEAAMIGSNTAPGLNRTFAFQNWSEYDADLFEKVKNQLTALIDEEADLKIYARDILTKNIDIISQNAENSKMEDFLSLKKEDFFVSIPKTESGLVIINPPYGERLKMTNIEDFYKKIGDALKQNYSNFDAWIISTDFNALKHIGLKSSFRLDMKNGGLDARLLKFEMYKGKLETE